MSWTNTSLHRLLINYRRLLLLHLTGFLALDIVRRIAFPFYPKNIADVIKLIRIWMLWWKQFGNAFLDWDWSCDSGLIANCFSRHRKLESWLLVHWCSCIQLHKLIIINTLLNILEKVDICILLYFLFICKRFYLFWTRLKYFCFNCKLLGVAKFNVGHRLLKDYLGGTDW